MPSAPIAKIATASADRLSERAVSGFARFVAVSTAVAAACIAAGWWPTARFAGEEATGALVAGCAISWAASLFGALPLARLRSPGGLGAASPVVVLAPLASMGLRFAAVVLLGAVAALRGPWPARPLLVWIALSYLPLLGVDIGFALGASRGARATNAEGPERSE